MPKSLETSLKELPGGERETPGKPAPSPSQHTITLHQACQEQIENLHGIFVCWFKGLRPKEELEKELLDRITPGFSHVAPNGQFLKGRANLLHNLLEKFKAYPSKAFDIQIENVKVVWTCGELVLATYEEWQWWRDVDSEDEMIRFGRLSTCLLRQRPGNFHWIHVHETWLEGVGPNDVLNVYDDQSDTSGSYDVEVTYRTSEVENGKKKVDIPVEDDLGYEEPQDDPNKKDGRAHVRFSNQREEVSYSYKKSSPKRAEPLPEESEYPSKKEAKTPPAAAQTKKPVVMLTPVPPQAQTPSNASRRRHISPQLTDYAKACMVNNELIGISIHGWDIGTGQGPMVDETWFSVVTTNFEKVAQYRGPDRDKKVRRRINLPEMVFPAAHVAFEHRKQNLWISWDVLDALDEWAKAHKNIPLHSDDECNGVSVLKSENAELWAKKKKAMMKQKSSDAFHMDWTYSSPFCGSVEGGTWQPLAKSGLKLDMLKDKSIPILFFDELVLYEDDLHDNGHVQFSLKIRVMPTCAFVLARMYVRIDRVLLRLRETRMLFEFDQTGNQQDNIYRDVTWRECHWQDLPAYKLPTNVKMWCGEGGNETAQLQMFMSKLPEVDLPEGIPKHAQLKRNGRPKK